MVFEGGEGGRPRGPPAHFPRVLSWFFEGGGREGGIEGGRGGHRDPYAHFPRVFQWFLKGEREAERTPCAFFSCFIVVFEGGRREGGRGRGSLELVLKGFGASNVVFLVFSSGFSQPPPPH